MSNKVLNAVWDHSAAKGSARLVLLAMADEANDEGLLTAYRRSYSHLARKANTDASTVRRAVQQLAELGEVQVLTTGSGRTQADYRVTLPGVGEGRQDAHPAPAAATPSVGSTPSQSAAGAHPISPLFPTPAPVAQPTRADCLTDYDVATFDAFWTAYPRHTAKGEARKAWPAAVRAAGGTGPIIDGAKRFAADPNREDAYTPHPATWLRAERWGDDPLPPRARQANGRAPARPSEWDRSAPSGVIEL